MFTPYWQRTRYFQKADNTTYLPTPREKTSVSAAAQIFAGLASESSAPRNTRAARYNRTLEGCTLEKHYGEGYAYYLLPSLGKAISRSLDARSTNGNLR